MDDDQFLKLSKEFKTLREKLDHLPRVIDGMMIEELNLRRSAHLNNRDDLQAKIDKIKKERENLQTELIDSKAFLPILRKRMIDASKEICEGRIKIEEERIEKLRDDAEAAKSRLSVSVAEAAKAIATIWGVESARKQSADYIWALIDEHLKYIDGLPKIGIQEKLAEAIDRCKKEQNILQQLSGNPPAEKMVEPIDKILDFRIRERSKEEKVRDWVVALANAKDPRNRTL